MTACINSARLRAKSMHSFVFCYFKGRNLPQWWLWRACRRQEPIRM